ncbi:MAG: sugar kinase [Ferruginibacter sp.]|nr:sugar kinase [Ferruginibacter sp.]
MQDNNLAAGKKICCFGEMLLRFSPKLDGGFIADNSMPVFIGGAELNVATALALWHIPVKYCTALPENYLAEEIIDHIGQKNIDTSSIYFSGERIGSYYLPQGKDLKNNAVIYDRNYSSFSQLKPGDLDWDEILQDVSWLHFSAISPALNENAAAVCLEGLQAASAKNITISVDLNYRAKLWQYGKQPHEVMPELVKYCQVIMGNIWALEKLLDIKHDPDFDTFLSKKADYLLQADRSVAEVFATYPACTHIANTFRFDEGLGIRYYAGLSSRTATVMSSEYATRSIVDKIGSGDCFMGGLIYGLTNNLPDKDVIEFAAAAAFDKLQQTGDATTSTIEHITQTIYNNG